ncbi:MAG: acyltransferase [Vicinamibacteria bacterium]
MTTHVPLRASARDVRLGYLRVFLTVLVVAHHAALAYHPFAPPAPSSLRTPPQLFAAFPIVDAQKWPAAPLFVGFNDVFFMSLLFLVSGVFVPSSLGRKGASAFLRDRALTLGIPFVVSAAVLAPLAYYPSYRQTGPADAGAAAFVREWLAIGAWPAGPAWFLWVLLAFATTAALVYRLAPRALDALGRRVGRLSARPAPFFLAVVAVSAAAYLPMAAAFRPEHWSGVGPFWVQTSRLLHYAAYFAIGMGLGAHGLDRDLFAHDGKLARRWPLWVAGSLAAFAVSLVAFFRIVATFGGAGSGPSAALSTFGNFTFVLSCAATSLACLAVFVRFARRAVSVLDGLSEDAYGIYLFHYAAVSFLQLGLLGTSLPGGLKMAAVTAAAVSISWLVTHALRLMPIIRRVI